MIKLGLQLDDEKMDEEDVPGLSTENKEDETTKNAMEDVDWKAKSSIK